MTDRNYTRNPGMISVPEADDDKWIAGAVIVLLDEDGQFHCRFKNVSIDEMPVPEVQEELASWIKQAWDLSRFVGIEE